MGVQVNSGLTTAQITGTITATQSLTYPSASQTPVYYYSVASVSTGNKYTVTATKTLYITSMQLMGGTLAAGTGISVSNNGTNMVWISSGTNATLVFPTPLKITTNVTITTAGTPGTAFFCFQGFEQ